MYFPSRCIDPGPSTALMTPLHFFVPFAVIAFFVGVAACGASGGAVQCFPSALLPLHGQRDHLDVGLLCSWSWSLSLCLDDGGACAADVAAATELWLADRDPAVAAILVGESNRHSDVSGEDAKGVWPLLVALEGPAYWKRALATIKARTNAQAIAASTPTAHRYVHRAFPRHALAVARPRAVDLLRRERRHELSPDGARSLAARPAA